jgi:hypothetical protein
LGATGDIAYVALGEEFVEKLAGLLLVLLDLIRLRISFAPRVVEHRVQQVLLEFPLLRLCKFMKKLRGVGLRSSMDIRGIGSWRKYDGIISRSFSLISRCYFRLLFPFSLFISSAPEVSGVALVLAPAANGNNFFGSLGSGSRVGSRLRVGRGLSRSSSRSARRYDGGVWGNDGR